MTLFSKLCTQSTERFFERIERKNHQAFVIKSCFLNVNEIINVTRPNEPYCIFVFTHIQLIHFNSYYFFCVILEDIKNSLSRVWNYQ